MRTHLLILLSLSACASLTNGNDDQRVNAAASDPALRRCINGQLGFAADSKVSVDIAKTVRHLDCIDEGVRSLKGLRHYTNLETISLWENNIESISELKKLKRLRWLELGNNNIRDIRPLATLNSLTRLGLSSNEISDIGPVSELLNLTWLNLDDNQITSLDALNNLDAITWLTIDHNQVENTDILDAIASQGADVYHQHQSGGASGPPAPTTEAVDAHAATFLPVLLDNDTVELDVVLGRSVHPVRMEFSGTLSIDGENVVLNRNGHTFRIGQTDGNTAQLCEQQEQCAVALGIKTAPPEAYAGLRPEPVVSMALAVSGPPSAGRSADNETDEYGVRDTELIDYVLASPNQFDAGSCLFMTTTGAMELLIHQDTDLDSVEYNGDTDLSERFLMTAYQDVPTSVLSYWLTDTAYTYNHIGGSLLNRDYPFTAGYVRETSNGSVVPCDPGDNGAYYSCSYNWFDERPSGWESLLVDTPTIERTVAFTDPARSSNSQWNVGLMDDEDVEKIKYMLRTRRAPIVVIYNHYLYWHADLIVGYDDSVQTNGCPMVEASMDYFDEEGSSAYTRKIQNHMDDIGDCTSQGIFYVRDSIYDGTSSEIDYEYSPGFTEKYSERIVERTYNWVKYLGNHAYALHRK